MALKKPSVERLPRSDLEGIIRAIEQDGCCIIQNFTHPDTVEKVNNETQPFIEADKPWIVSFCAILLAEHLCLISRHRVLCSRQRRGDVQI
jgi:hypothetical protein